MGGERRTGLVLSGGGARGAYEAGVVRGIIEVLGLLPRDRTPFDIFAGTSVGAINTAFLAANAQRGDLNVNELGRIWTNLRIDHHLRFDLAGFLGLETPRLPFIRRKRQRPKPRFGHYFLDPSQLEDVVKQGVAWPQLRQNLSRGVVHALIVAALHIGSGRTTMFVDLSPNAEFRPSGDPRRIARTEEITADHVLGSAAIPLVFPARRIDGRYYCDGGIRFNTPIAPAIRSGADRLVVVSLLRQPEPGPVDTIEDALAGAYPHPAFLLGKILNALLLDPVAYDLYVLDRFNRLLELLGETHTDEEMDRVNNAMIESRGHSYKRIEALAFTPSEDIGVLASVHLRETAKGGAMERLRYWLLGFAGQEKSTWEADLASYIMFDGGFAERLVDLGYRDALGRAEDINDFFG